MSREMCAVTQLKQLAAFAHPSERWNACEARKIPASAKKVPVLRSGFPARSAQGIRGKPLRQLHKTACKSSGGAALRKTSLQTSLRQGMD
jgi:hypothetical protein